MSIIPRNNPCNCWSGKKYKHCCWLKIDYSMEILQRKLVNNELPFFARIVSPDWESSSMRIQGASITRNWVETRIFEDEVTLSTNSIEMDGENISSSAMITIPINNKKPIISISGNASVDNNQEFFRIKPLDSKKWMKIKGENLFARIKTCKREAPYPDFFDILFWDPLKWWRHTHIAFHPDWNGRYVWFRNYKCSMANTLNYDTTQKTILPSEVTIEVQDFSEKLCIQFEGNNKEKIIGISKAYFKMM